ncbi:choline dehydrogenase, mitochondrial-like [Dendronephthya gigantea]|uniref:choline dehydrogenase, mitochondrial-like n=1 Tax=Dendronephthya gigantea TaxID=151771 RepID=UPI00106A11C5|nr:choline dehydrogenase, mitochondrial-like [Dendronephthya gigantea]
MSCFSQILRRNVHEFMQLSRFNLSNIRHLSTPTLEFDYVIVGAGSAGCVLANRLSEDKANRVALLEAGPKDNTWTIQMPAALTYNLANNKYNWFYHTVPQKHLNDRVIYCPRGRVWGGSSSLNAMVYIRGHAYDYDRWESEGCDGWSYADCLPYFKKAQNHCLGEDDYRGGSGPLHVSQGNWDNPLFKAFVDAAVQAGYKYTPDMNGYRQAGFGPMDMTIHKGKRWSTANAYLKPVLGRTNLVVLTETFTRKLCIENNKVVGVDYHNAGKKIGHVRATKEVILASGGINSAQLLMLSGIGNGDDLKELGIPVSLHLPGVGYNLQDHLEVYVQHECTQPITLYTAQKPWNMMPIGVQWFAFRTGFASSSHLEAGGFVRTREDIPHPDVQFHFFPSLVIDHGRVRPNKEGFQAHVGTMRAFSRGYMKLDPTNPYHDPLIQPNYFEHPQDIIDMRAAVKIARKVFAQKALDPFRGPEVTPGVDVTSDSAIDEFLRKKADTSYHPCGTCKMGPENDPMAVVNPSGCVYGIEGLRVVDSSIMPSIVSGNLNAPTIMMAEKLADVILGKQALPKLNSPVCENVEK